MMIVMRHAEKIANDNGLCCLHDKKFHSYPLRLTDTYIGVMYDQREDNKHTTTNSNNSEAK